MGKAEKPVDPATENKTDTATAKPIENDAVQFQEVVGPQITALSDKIFAVRPDASISGDKGAIGVAIDMLGEYSGQINDLADAILVLDLRGTEEGGAVDIAVLRLQEYRALLDAKPEQAEAPAPGFDIALAEAQLQVNKIAQSMIPLGQYLQAEGLMVVEESQQINVAMIAAAALQALQEVKAGAVEMQGKIEALTPDPSQVKHKRTKPISVASKVEDEEFERASTVVFGDSDGNLITDLAPLSFSSDKFGGSAIGRTLNADIEFPVHGPARTVAAAFLVDAKGKAVSICELVSPLSVSGGGSARINSGSLLFRAPEKPQAEADAA